MVLLGCRGLLPRRLGPCRQPGAAGRHGDGFQAILPGPANSNRPCRWLLLAKFIADADPRRTWRPRRTEGGLDDGRVIPDRRERPGYEAAIRSKTGRPQLGGCRVLVIEEIVHLGKEAQLLRRPVLAVQIEDGIASRLAGAQEKRTIRLMLAILIAAGGRT